MSLVTEEIIQKLRNSAKQKLSALIGDVKDVVLLDYPNHDNVGDNAIWMGEKAFLKELGLNIHYVCDNLSYSPEKIRAKLPKGIILIHGGGNFGDLWEWHENLRHKIVTEFKDYKIIQLPQTVFYGDKAKQEAAKRIYKQHPDFTVMVRDAVSLKIVQEEMELKSELCPDMAFGLKLKRRHPAIQNIFCLKRIDCEASSQGTPDCLDGIEVRDWVFGYHSMLESFFARLESLARFAPRRLSWLHTFIGRYYDARAMARINYGIDMLSRGHFVIADRLHAHILCLLLDIPHALVDNHYGKLKSFLSAWTGQSDITFYRENFEEAADFARGYNTGKHAAVLGKSPQH